MTITEINTAIARFFNDNFTGWTAVGSHQNQPKISDKQISYYIERFKAVGSDCWISASEIDTSVVMLGIRDLWLSVTFTGDGATQASWDFVNIHNVGGTGFESIDADSPAPIGYLQGTKYIDRVEFPWRIRVNTEYSRDDGRIESGKISGVVDDIAVEIDFKK